MFVFINLNKGLIMESMAKMDHIYTDTIRRVKESLVRERSPLTGSARHSIYKALCKDGSEDFYNYLDWLDLAGIRKTLILPKENNFFYSCEDLSGKELIVNLSCLNRVADIHVFLDSMYNHMDLNSYFTGCFRDINSVKEEIPDYMKYLKEVENQNTEGKTRQSALSRFSQKLSSIFSSSNGIPINKDLAKKLLKINGFTVLDMTELNGKTFFCVQKRPEISN